MALFTSNERRALATMILTSAVGMGLLACNGSGAKTDATGTSVTSVTAATTVAGGTKVGDLPLSVDLPPGAVANDGAPGFHSDDESIYVVVKKVDDTDAKDLASAKKSTQEILFKKWVKAEKTADGWVMSWIGTGMSMDGKATETNSYSVRRRIGDASYDCYGSVKVAANVANNLKRARRSRPRRRGVAEADDDGSARWSPALRLCGADTVRRTYVRPQLLNRRGAAAQGTCHVHPSSGGPSGSLPGSRAAMNVWPLASLTRTTTSGQGTRLSRSESTCWRLLVGSDTGAPGTSEARTNTMRRSRASSNRSSAAVAAARTPVPTLRRIA